MFLSFLITSSIVYHALAMPMDHDHTHHGHDHQDQMSPPSSSSIANLTETKPIKIRPVLPQIHLSKMDQVTVDEELIAIRHKSPLEQERDLKAFGRTEGGLIKRKIDVILEAHNQAVEIFIEEMAEKLAKMSLREAKSGGDHVVLIMTDKKLTAAEKAERVKDAVERLSKDAQKELMEANLADASHIVKKNGHFLNGPAFGL